MEKISASLGHTRAQLSLAADYIDGTSFTKRNIKKGLNLAQKAFTKPDARFYLGEIADSLSNYYLSMNDKASINQAYLWCLIAYASDRGKLTASIPNKLTLLASPDTDNILNVSKPIELESNIKLPSKPPLLLDSKRLNLNKHPVLSLYHFVPFSHWELQEYSLARSYALDIYSDGRVYFSINNRLDRSQNIELLTKLNSIDFNNMMNEIMSDNFIKKSSTIHFAKYANGCGIISCDEINFGNPSTAHIFNTIHASIPSYYYLNIRHSKKLISNSYFGREGNFVPLDLAKTLGILEKYVPTQQYRCGSVTNRQYYKDCIAFDDFIINQLTIGEKQ